MTASEFRWPSGEPMTVESVAAFIAPMPNAFRWDLLEGGSLDARSVSFACLRFMASELSTSDATLARVRALADRWAADNQTVWAEELRKVLEGAAQ